MHMNTSRPKRRAALKATVAIKAQSLKRNGVWLNHEVQTKNRLGYSVFRQALHVQVPMSDDNIMQQIQDFCSEYIDSRVQCSSITRLNRMGSDIGVTSPHCDNNPMHFSGDDVDGCSYSLFVALETDETIFSVWEGSHLIIRYDHLPKHSFDMPVQRRVAMKKGDLLLMRSDLVYQIKFKKACFKDHYLIEIN